MRILIVGVNYAPEPTGIAPYTTGMAEGLRARGHSVRVITGYPSYPMWRIFDGYRGRRREEAVRNVPITRLRHYVPKTPRLVNRLAMELHFGLRSVITRWGRPDVVIAVSPALFSARMALAKARLKGVPGILWIQDIYSLGISETGRGTGLSASALRAIESSAARSAARTIVIHDRFKRYAIEGLHADAAKVDVVRNWTHIADVDGRDRAATRRRHGWADDDIVVLHAGNMGVKQNLENVVHASHLADGDASRVRFVLLGDGNRRAALTAMGAGQRLQFIDPLPDDDFRAALAAADLLLVNEKPGLTEMCVPSKLTSYFSAGVPVIAATDEGSITSDEIRDSRAGVRIDAGDPSALLAAAAALGTDPDRARTYAQAGLAYKNERLSARLAVDEFELTIGAAVGARTTDERSAIVPG